MLKLYPAFALHSTCVQLLEKGVYFFGIQCCYIMTKLTKFGTEIVPLFAREIPILSCNNV